MSNDGRDTPLDNFIPLFIKFVPGDDSWVTDRSFSPSDLLPEAEQGQDQQQITMVAPQDASQGAREDGGTNGDPPRGAPQIKVSVQVDVQQARPPIIIVVPQDHPDVGSLRSPFA